MICMQTRGHAHLLLTSLCSSLSTGRPALGHQTPRRWSGEYQTNVGHNSVAQTVIFLSIHDTGNPDSNVLVLICVRNNPQCWYLVPITLDLE